MGVRGIDRSMGNRGMDDAGRERPPEAGTPGGLMIFYGSAAGTAAAVCGFLHARVDDEPLTPWRDDIIHSDGLRLVEEFLLDDEREPVVLEHLVVLV